MIADRGLDFLVYRWGDSETVNPTKTSYSVNTTAFANTYDSLVGGPVSAADASTYGAVQLRWP